MSGEYYCTFCNEPIWDSLHMCKGKYDHEMAKARYETKNWDDSTVCPYWREIMGKPNVIEPVITGKAAKQFEKMFLTNSVPSPERVEQNKKDVATYLSALEPVSA